MSQMFPSFLIVSHVYVKVKIDVSISLECKKCAKNSYLTHLHIRGYQVTGALRKKPYITLIFLADSRLASLANKKILTCKALLINVISIEISPLRLLNVPIISKPLPLSPGSQRILGAIYAVGVGAGPKISPKSPLVFVTGGAAGTRPSSFYLKFHS